ncbi:Amino-acid acetyltransferase [Cupriavidus yeoncheonensis]|uniref:Amino-acid acetyltransferase n=1 Tax=Cupriavidus yeoncheonensis TaxID=1462994 RepID=A0A916N5S6_9BURK|nr:GNAT family N-acetyltransferase [Cupriavidus yeoncheonensis]CAG2152986.1 Amino-acid acetyltransferase [Cupriavidus yeoncheonensis]
MRPYYATEADWPDIEALLRASSLFCEEMHDHLAQYMIARDNSGLLGCAGIERYETTGVLRTLAVAQRARSAGLGELLVAAIVADVRQQGIETIVLQTKNASGYFARLGFTRIGVSDLPSSIRPSHEFDRGLNEMGTLMQTSL